MKSHTENVVDWIKTIVHEEGYQLVDLIVKGSVNSPIFQVFIDHENGIKVSNCSYLHRKILDVIDMHSEEIGLSDYRIEVSSPGIDRPLQNAFDFNKNRGRQVVISCDFQGSEVKIQGVVLEARMDSVDIQIDKKIRRVLFDSILSAKIKLQW